MGPGSWDAVPPTAASCPPSSRGRAGIPSKWAHVPEAGLCALLGPSGAAIYSLEGHLMPFPEHCLKVARKLVHHPLGVGLLRFSQAQKA